MQKLSLLLFVAFIIVSCSSDQTKDQEELVDKVSIQEEMKGTWEVKYLKVEVESYQNQDSSFVFEVSEDIWERVYGVRPFRYFFAPDSTFRSVRRDIAGTLIGEERGLWQTFGDTLQLLQDNATPQYKVLIEKGQAQWAGVVDWDMDGVRDDTYFATYRFVGKTSNE